MSIILVLKQKENSRFIFEVKIYNHFFVYHVIAHNKASAMIQVSKAMLNQGLSQHFMKNLVLVKSEQLA